MDCITLAGFVLALDVTGVVIMNGVRKVVVCWCVVFHMSRFYQQWSMMSGMNGNGNTIDSGYDSE